ncbi:hypothetical protein DIPPA_31903 [Diplonema papillatum]|nr:hypothetical protein DIPPA_31903 [Diplonema papillatum]KAJ9447577.1 hypothetical protein DIPPA_31903 [Diplonema papillatum]KAJ9447578.1 hypothetical protein DIPPA_31903 [Diplonema papillatum]
MPRAGDPDESVEAVTVTLRPQVNGQTLNLEVTSAELSEREKQTKRLKDSLARTRDELNAANRKADAAERRAKTLETRLCSGGAAKSFKNLDSKYQRLARAHDALRDAHEQSTELLSEAREQVDILNAAVSDKSSALGCDRDVLIDVARGGVMFQKWQAAVAELSMQNEELKTENGFQSTELTELEAQLAGYRQQVEAVEHLAKTAEDEARAREAAERRATTLASELAEAHADRQALLDDRERAEKLQVLADEQEERNSLLAEEIDRLRGEVDEAAGLRERLGEAEAEASRWKGACEAAEAAKRDAQLVAAGLEPKLVELRDREIEAKAVQTELHRTREACDLLSEDCAAARDDAARLAADNAGLRAHLSRAESERSAAEEAQTTAHAALRRENSALASRLASLEAASDRQTQAAAELSAENAALAAECRGFAALRRRASSLEAEAHAAQAVADNLRRELECKEREAERAHLLYSVSRGRASPGGVFPADATPTGMPHHLPPDSTASAVVRSVAAATETPGQASSQASQPANPDDLGRIVPAARGARQVVDPAAFQRQHESSAHSYAAGWSPTARKQSPRLTNPDNLQAADQLRSNAAGRGIPAAHDARQVVDPAAFESSSHSYAAGWSPSARRKSPQPTNPDNLQAADQLRSKAAGRGVPAAHDARQVVDPAAFQRQHESSSHSCAAGWSPTARKESSQPTNPDNPQKAADGGISKSGRGSLSPGKNAPPRALRETRRNVPPPPADAACLGKRRSPDGRPSQTPLPRSLAAGGSPAASTRPTVREITPQAANPDGVGRGVSHTEAVARQVVDPAVFQQQREASTRSYAARGSPTAYKTSSQPANPDNLQAADQLRSSAAGRSVFAAHDAHQGAVPAAHQQQRESSSHSYAAAPNNPQAADQKDADRGTAGDEFQGRASAAESNDDTGPPALLPASTSGGSDRIDPGRVPTPAAAAGGGGGVPRQALAQRAAREPLAWAAAAADEGAQSPDPFEETSPVVADAFAMATTPPKGKPDSARPSVTPQPSRLQTAPFAEAPSWASPRPSTSGDAASLQRGRTPSPKPKRRVITLSHLEACSKRA